MLTAKTVAALLGLSIRAVYSLPIPWHQFGRAVRYAPADVEAYRDACRSPAQKTTRAVLGSAMSSTVSLKDEGSALLSYFRSRGIVPKRKSTAVTKTERSTALRLVQSQEP